MLRHLYLLCLIPVIVLAANEQDTAPVEPCGGNVTYTTKTYVYIGPGNKTVDKCTWTFDSTFNKIVIVTLYTKKLETKDTIVVKTNKNESYTTTGPQGEIMIVIRDGMNTTIEYTASTNVSDGRFKLGFTISDDCTLTVPSEDKDLGTLASPLMGMIREPVFLPNVNDTKPTLCKWTLNTVDVYAIVVSFYSFTGDGILSYKETKAGSRQFKAGDIIPDIVSDSSTKFDILLNLTKFPDSTKLRAVYTLDEFDQKCSHTITLKGDPAHTLMPIKHYKPKLCRWIIQIDEPGSTIVARFLNTQKEEQLRTGEMWLLFDGPNQFSNILGYYDSKSTDFKNDILVTSRQDLVVEYFGVEASNFNISVQKQTGGGHYMDKSEDLSFTGNGPTYYALETKPKSQIVFRLDKPITSDGNITLYDGINMDTPIAVIDKTRTLLSVPSDSNKMLVVSQGFGTEKLKGNFSTAEEGCFTTSNATSGVYSLNSNNTKVCLWKIMPKNLLLKVNRIVLPDKVEVAIIPFAGDRIQLVNGMQEPTDLFFTDNITVVVTNSSANFMGIIDLALSYSVVTKENFCGGDIALKDVKDFLPLTSPLYPNSYPLNAQCSWKITPNKATNTSTAGTLVYLQLTKLALAEGHKIEIFKQVVNKSDELIATFDHTNKMKDVISNEVTLIKFTTPINKTAKGVSGYQSNYGFAGKVYSLDCGGYMNATSTDLEVSTPNYPKPSPNMTRCIWIIEAPQDATKAGKSINAIKLVTKEGDKAPAQAELVVRDGCCLDSERLSSPDHDANGNDYTSTSYVVNIAYNMNLTADPKNNGTSFDIKFKEQACDTLCDVTLKPPFGICMDPAWVCNGVANCQDASDEKGCVTITNKVPSGTVAAAVIFSLIAGAVIVFLGQFMYKYYQRRQSSYTQFRDIDT